MASTSPTKSKNVRAVFLNLIGAGKVLFSELPAENQTLDKKMGWSITVAGLLRQFDRLLPALHSETGLESALAEVHAWKAAVARVDGEVKKMEAEEAGRMEAEAEKMDAERMVVDEGQNDLSSSLGENPSKREMAEEQASEKAPTTEDIAAGVPREAAIFNHAQEDGNTEGSDESSSSEEDEPPEAGCREAKSPSSVHSVEDRDGVPRGNVAKPQSPRKVVSVYVPPRQKTSASPAKREQSPPFAPSEYELLVDGSILFAHPTKKNDEGRPVLKLFTITTGPFCDRCKMMDANCLSNSDVKACWQCYKNRKGCSFVKQKKDAGGSEEPDDLAEEPSTEPKKTGAPSSDSARGCEARPRRRVDARVDSSGEESESFEETLARTEEEELLAKDKLLRADTAMSKMADDFIRTTFTFRTAAREYRKRSEATKALLLARLNDMEE
ncbi:hypothetical protein BD410DRAFT_846522 [Rickenella mellea]|uniref:Uncharacterized protein n=1 Tax=Rickenella mellea TaxID=50990 RepID=A0A4Y7PGD0_9AGAM|nr:hypothetical protein BD410DRAFT_846522 [Rickenella mellea]